MADDPEEEAPEGLVARARGFVYRRLWDVDESRLGAGRQFLLTLVRLIFVTADSFWRERLQIRAAALAFWTILSIVPAAALTFSLAKGLGLYDSLITNTVRPFVDRTFPATRGGDGALTGVQVLRDNFDQLLELVSSTDVFGLGIIGLVVLLITIWRVVRLAEESFDAIWGFSGRRAFARRLPGYIIVPLFTPILLSFATTLTAARHGEPAMALIGQWIPIPFLVDVIAFVLPPLVVCLAMLPVYLLIPSARVRKRSAFFGALVGGLGWYLFQVAHVAFQVGVARNNALYSGFGAFPIFLLWLHLSWVWVLLGGQVAAAHQNAPTLRQLARHRLEDHASRQAVALRAMVALVDHEDAGGQLRELAREVGVAVEPLRDVLDDLTEHDLLVRSEGDYNPRYAPKADLQSLRVASVLSALGRGRTEDVAGKRPWEKAEEPLTRVLKGLQSAAESSSHNRTIGELRRSSSSRQSVLPDG